MRDFVIQAKAITGWKRCIVTGGLNHPDYTCKVNFAFYLSFTVVAQCDTRYHWDIWSLVLLFREQERLRNILSLTHFVFIGYNTIRG